MRDHWVMPDIETAGRLLISSPSMSDRNFDRTVVLMLEHAEEGAIGVVINRPSPIDLADAVPQWSELAADPRVVFFGGPVAQGSVIALASADPVQAGPELTPITASTGVLDLSKEPADLVVPIEKIRIFSGYSGWGAGQLDNELRSGAWFVIEPAESDPFSPTPDGLWTDVLKRGEAADAMRTQDPLRHWLN